MVWALAKGRTCHRKQMSTVYVQNLSQNCYKIFLNDPNKVAIAQLTKVCQYIWDASERKRGSGTWRVKKK